VPASVQEMQYDQFLLDFDADLLSVLRPMDVLRFWRIAGSLQADEPWLAVFAIDEVRALRGCCQRLQDPQYCSLESVATHGTLHA